MYVLNPEKYRIPYMALNHEKVVIRATRETKTAKNRKKLLTIVNQRLQMK